MNKPFLDRDRWRTRETMITCPACQTNRLIVFRSCLRTSVQCAHCNRTFSVGELASLLDEKTFSELAELIGDQLSDRI
jgi:hypothetical protein